MPKLTGVLWPDQRPQLGGVFEVERKYCMGGGGDREEGGVGGEGGEGIGLGGKPGKNTV